LKDLAIYSIFINDGSIIEEKIPTDEKILLKAIFYGVKTDWSVQGLATVDGVKDLWVYKVVEFTYNEFDEINVVARVFTDVPSPSYVRKVKVEPVGLVDDSGFIWSYASYDDAIKYRV
jgi:hypothetical protein